MLTVGYIISTCIFAIAFLDIIECIDHKKRITAMDILAIVMEICFIISWR